MKIKYLRLPKAEKKKAKELYYATPKGKALKSKLKLVLVSAIGLLICSLLILAEAIVKHKSPWDYAYGICLGIIAIIFFAVSHHLRIKRINDYLVNNKVKL